MNPRVCICCGEPMAEAGHALSRNPNLCASCSSLADGMDEAGPSPMSLRLPAQNQSIRSTVPTAPNPDGEVLLDWAAEQVFKKPRATA